MSRIGKKPIEIPGGVEVKINGNTISVKGTKGTLTREISPRITASLDGNVLSFTRASDDKKDRSLHGLTRSLVNNMIIGVSEGFKKELEVNGVGYRVQKQGKKLVLNLGYSHQVFVEDTDDVTTEIKGNVITVLGMDKQKVGQFAAELREKRPPEPYKGKGIKYVDEYIRRKEGKAGKGK